MGKKESRDFEILDDIMEHVSVKISEIASKAGIDPDAFEEYGSADFMRRLYQFAGMDKEAEDCSREFDVLIKKHPRLPRQGVELIANAAVIVELDKSYAIDGSLDLKSRASHIQNASFLYGMAAGIFGGEVSSSARAENDILKVLAKKGADALHARNRKAKMAVFNLLDANPPKPRGKEQAARDICRSGIHITERTIRKWIDEWEKQRFAGPGAGGGQ